MVEGDETGAIGNECTAIHQRFDFFTRYQDARLLPNFRLGLRKAAYSCKAANRYC